MPYAHHKVAAHALLPDNLADAYHKAAYQLNLAAAQITRLAITEFLQRRGYYQGKLTPLNIAECNQVRYKRGSKPLELKYIQLQLFTQAVPAPPAPQPVISQALA